MSERSEPMHTYTFSWSGPFSLSEEEEKALTVAMSKLVLDRVPFFGAASLKHEVESPPGLSRNGGPGMVTPI